MQLPQPEPQYSADDQAHMRAQIATEDARNYKRNGLDFTQLGTGAIRRSFQDKLRDTVDVRDFGVKGNGSEGDGTELQRWLDAIPAGGSGRISAADVYYVADTDLTKSGHVHIQGVGTASRIHYPGSGIALSLSAPRFSRLENFFLTGTSSATGGLYVTAAQEGYFDSSVFIEGFTGAAAYARRFSSCWTGMIVGGKSEGNTNGVIFDTALGDGVNPINNSFNIHGHDCANNSGIGIDFQSGFLVNIVGCDFSNTGTGIEIGRAITGSDTIRNVNIFGNYFESTNCIYIGRGATTSAAPSYIDIRTNYLNGGTNCIHLYVADSVTIGPQTMAGTNTIDSGVTGTQWSSENALTDNSAAGNTTYIRGNTGLIQAASVTLTSFLKVPTYTVSTLPTATAGRVIYVSNETGGATLAFSDGTNWRRVQDRNVVS